MKIHEVEALTGIPKKSIRFYEAEGLLQPSRDSGNGYRQYSAGDIETLRYIKVWRKLDMPVDEIRRILSGELTVLAALERQRIALAHQHGDLETRRRLCDRLIESAAQGESIDPLALLEEMAALEKAGIHFHPFLEKDRRKKLRGVWFAAAGFALFMLAMAILVWWAYSVDPIPVWLLIVLEAFMLLPAIGVFIAGYTRMKEIKGGEEDDLGNY